MKGAVLLEKMKGPAIFRAVKQEWKRWRIQPGRAGRIKNIGCV